MDLARLGDVADVEEVVARHAPELEPKIHAAHRIGPYGIGLVAGGYVALGAAYLLLGVEYWINPLFLPLLLLVTLVTIGLSETFVRIRHRGDVRRFRESIVTAPWAIHGRIAENFRRKIAEQRERTLGAGSDWQRARHPLQEALAEANRSIAYWRARLEQDPADGGPSSHLETAERLKAKFEAAIVELDGRSSALLDFFDSCEAKLVVLERSKRDYEESRRLAELSDKADELIADAETTLMTIGQQFVTEALRVGEALGSLERIQLRDLAGELPLEHMESVADRIIESSASEQQTLSELVERLGEETSPS